MVRDRVCVCVLSCVYREDVWLVADLATWPEGIIGVQASKEKQVMGEVHVLNEGAATQHR